MWKMAGRWGSGTTDETRRSSISWRACSPASHFSWLSQKCRAKRFRSGGPSTPTCTARLRPSAPKASSGPEQPLAMSAISECSSCAPVALASCCWSMSSVSALACMPSKSARSSAPGWPGESVSRIRGFSTCLFRCLMGKSRSLGAEPERTSLRTLSRSSPSTLSEALTSSSFTSSVPCSTKRLTACWYTPLLDGSVCTAWSPA
mmetsp:Transcript_71233/g.201886  ORF Transcript_71233/g.201886 Transcript_71233/m.201886 type:complete len:204 (+) Transcript_71233:246-857(+)